jgi:prepilin-type processing-associated H-X9-DG protein
MVGERPPSADLVWGWWFAGSGWDNWGEGDVVLGSNAVPYANSIAPACKSNPKVGLQEGNVKNACDQSHFWSLHTGGANFIYADASVHWLPYTTSPAIFQALSTKDGNEVIDTSDL